MNVIPLFASNLIETFVDPSTYDKQTIIDTVKENYKLDPNRNPWDKSCDFHNYHNDWDNPNFKNIGSLLEPLKSIYDSVLNDYLSSVANNYEFESQIVNITAFGSNQHMSVHSHYSHSVTHGMVHYISIPKDSSSITFWNPISVAQYPNVEEFNNFSEVTDKTIIHNSNFFEYYDLQPLEDYLYIFPSYLKHSVPKSKNSDVRIAVIINVKVRKKHE